MEKEEEEWEQELEEASLTLRRSRVRNGDTVFTDAQNSNGNSESNGHLKLAAADDDDNNGADQPGLPLHQEKIAALPHTQVEIHSKKTAVRDFETKSITPVYYDPKEGIWKCRICSWNYGTAYLSRDLVQNPNGHLDELMLFKTLDQRKSCYPPDLQGTQLNSTHSGEEHVEKNHGDGILDISTGNVSVQKDFDSILDCHVDGNKNESNSLSKILPEEYGTSSKSLNRNEIENEDVDLATESDLEVTEIDLERVLEKQNTHHLFCPNCNSCITRRVILRKRKCTVRHTSKDVKRNKPEAAVGSSFTQDHGTETSNWIHNSAEICSDGSPAPAGGNDSDHERKPDIFRCLSCFSFFIPTGNGFKIFQMFENKGKTNAVQNQQKSMRKSWISSMFGSREELISEPGLIAVGRDIRPDDTSKALLPSPNVNAQSFSEQKDHYESIPIDPPNGHKSIPVEASAGRVPVVNGKSPENGVTVTQTSTSNIPRDVPAGHQSGIEEASSSSSDKIPVNGKLPESVVSVNPPDGLKLLISSHGGSPTHQKLGTGQNPDLNIQTSSEDILHTGAMAVHNFDGRKSATVEQINHGVPNLNESSLNTIITNGVDLGELSKTSKDQSVFSAMDAQLVPDEQASIIKDLGKVTAELTEGKDAIIVVEPETVDKPDTQLSEHLNVPGETAAAPGLDTRNSVTERRRGDGGKSYQFDIMKSIVYGGLIESIVSLGVVSSAAGGGTATLNIVTLSLANLIGGLVLIFHNLWNLKKEQVRDQQHRDRYAELLGRRESFFLHATVAMLSFLIFGLIPPVTYGFSFRKSDGGRELKVLATVAAGLASVLVLASGKAYVGKQPKSYLKTIAYYIVMGFMVSGISYVVGDLLNGLLPEKPHFQSNSQGFLTLQQTTSTPIDWF